jgi:hypothetical protein
MPAPARRLANIGVAGGGSFHDRGRINQPTAGGLLRNRGYLAWVSRIFAAKIEKTPAKV